MDAVTYPEEKVYTYINENLIPLRVPADSKELAEKFNVKWTPTLINLDANGGEHHRTVGFFSADELIPSLILGSAKTYFDLDSFEDALKFIGILLEKYPKAAQIPEALFLQGVSLYKSTNDPSPLKKAYETLADQFPDSEWTKRAYPYRLL